MIFHFFKKILLSFWFEITYWSDFFKSHNIVIVALRRFFFYVVWTTLGRIWSNSIRTESVFPPCISSMCFFNSPHGNLQIFLKNKTLNRLKKSLNGEPSQTRASHDLFPLPCFDIPALMDSFRMIFFVSSYFDSSWPPRAEVLKGIFALERQNYVFFSFIIYEEKN